MKHDKTRKLETAKTRHKVWRLSQDTGIKNHVSRQSQDETRVSRLHHCSQSLSMTPKGLVVTQQKQTCINKPKDTITQNKQ